MKDSTQEDGVIQRLMQWAEDQADVRALLWTSSRTNPDAPVDVFSDYDIILVVKDIHPFFSDRSWLEDLGKVLVVYRDPISRDYGHETFVYVTQYEDGTKIDFTVWPVEIVQRVAEDAELPDYLDVGYKILLDKDHLTEGLKPPTYKAFIPTPPTEAEYETVIEEFFHETTYVAKNLWRDELMPAKYSLEFMKYDSLRKMLEWRMEIDHDWSVKTGTYGKGLKKGLHPEIWSQFEDTYVGAGLSDNWEALFKTIDLLRRVAIEVGEHLGHEYLHDLDRRMLDHLRKVKGLERRTETS